MEIQYIAAGGAAGKVLEAHSTAVRETAACGTEEYSIGATKKFAAFVFFDAGRRNSSIVAAACGDSDSITDTSSDIIGSRFSIYLIGGPDSGLQVCTSCRRQTGCMKHVSHIRINTGVLRKNDDLRVSRYCGMAKVRSWIKEGTGKRFLPKNAPKSCSWKGGGTFGSKGCKQYGQTLCSYEEKHSHGSGTWSERARHDGDASVSSAGVGILC